MITRCATGHILPKQQFRLYDLYVTHLPLCTSSHKSHHATFVSRSNMLPTAKVLGWLLPILVVATSVAVVVAPQSAAKVTKRFQMFDQRKLNWIAAQLACARHAMTLASIETAAEQTQVAGLLAQSPVRNSFWIGGTAQHVGDDFSWLSTGQPLAAYTNWAAGQPMAFGQECIVVGRKTFTWYTDNCGRIGPYVCQYFEAYDLE